MDFGRMVREAKWRWRIRKSLRHSQKVIKLLNAGLPVDEDCVTENIGNALGMLKQGFTALPVAEGRTKKVEDAMRWHANVLGIVQNNVAGGKLGVPVRMKLRDLMDQSAQAVRRAAN